MKKKSVKSQSRDVTVDSSEVLQASQKVGHFSLVRSASPQYRYYIAGAGSVLDLAGSRLRAPRLGSAEQDAAQLKKDFSVIGSDLRDVFLTQADNLG